MKTDKIYFAIGSTNNVVLRNFDAPDNPMDFDDVMKFSDCNQVLVSGVNVPGGQENALDVVRGTNYIFENSHFIGGNVAAVTLKGSVDGWEFDSCVFKGKLEIGMFDNYWKPGRAPTRNGAIKNCNTSDGSPLIVELWDATVPTIENTNVKFVRKSKWLWLPYFLLRFIMVKLHL